MSSGNDDPVTQAQNNIVAIFHASFHPTKGNTIDWSLTSPSPSTSASSSSSSPTLSLDGVEFSVLPSGLHLVQQDVIYFSHGSHTGLAVFRRRPTKAEGQRGFRLASLGILLGEGERPRPWVYVRELRELADRVYEGAERREREREGDADLLGLGDGSGGSRTAPGDLTEEDFRPAKEWFEARKVIPTAATAEKQQDTSKPTDVWSGWSDELDGTHASPSTPTHHLPHLLRILGLSSLTLYKFVLSRRRILIYTLPPVEVAGILAWITADLCREHHMSPRNDRTSFGMGVPMPSLFSQPKTTEISDANANNRNEGGEKQESPFVLGMITLSDLPRLEQLSSTGRGWIACTTDAIFLEKPQYYDLVVDLTTCTPSKASRPALYMSKSTSSGGSGIVSGISSGLGMGGGGGGGGSGMGRGKEKWKLETVRFTWSDVKLWGELDRILKLDSSQTAHHIHTSSGCCQPNKFPSPGSSNDNNNGNNVGVGGGGSITNSSAQSTWADAFKLYEDVCLLCAMLWMGLGTWRSNSRQSFSSSPTSPSERGGSGGRMNWGSARAPGDDDWSLEGTHMRTLGQGIEGGLSKSPSKKKDKDKGREVDTTKVNIRVRGSGIEGRPTTTPRAHGGHSRKASASSMMKLSPSQPYVESTKTSEGDRNADQEQDPDQSGAGRTLSAEEEQELRRRQTIQTTLALLQTFHANTVFWLSKLREVIPPPSAVSTPGVGSGSGAMRPSGRLPSTSTSTTTNSSFNEREEVGDDELEEVEMITISARDLLSLELGVLSELDAKFVEWLVEAEGYAEWRNDANVRVRDTRRGRRRVVVVKRGWGELVGILLGLK
ncbi:uncharacterized protein FOMMEDRAFT_169942 [Fomitiporia mediterranea MF3/22]|uniref:uncharacterized protein n=1 Tax=Fomitiporia mediterranea (strain MF3/22) TaxID=694068 RepID=UPI00044075D5|nr:uncharacterized protein FOMMEDRAFT_169942 [Fomitiporia mediterranea MF3/22]EJD00524.1 hypothetical protein FOMMEDRAFT_169942 [Fomitiporia mediterranea MF3/22]